MVYKTKPIKESLGGLEVSHLSEALLRQRSLVFRGRASFCILQGAPRRNKPIPLRHASFSFAAARWLRRRTRCLRCKQVLMRPAVFTTRSDRKRTSLLSMWPRGKSPHAPADSAWPPQVRGVLKPSASRRSIRTSIIVCRGRQRNRPALVSLKTAL